MEILSDDYILTVAYVEVPPCLQMPTAGNVLLTVYKRTEKWYIEYRFRYYADTKVFEESKDKKSFYRLSLKETNEDDILKGLGVFLDTVLQLYPKNTQVQRYTIKLSGKDYTDKILKEPLPFMQIKILPKKAKSN